MTYAEVIHFKPAFKTKNLTLEQFEFDLRVVPEQRDDFSKHWRRCRAKVPADELAPDFHLDQPFQLMALPTMATLDSVDRLADGTRRFVL